MSISSTAAGGAREHCACGGMKYYDELSKQIRERPCKVEEDTGPRIRRIHMVVRADVNDREERD